MCDVRYVENFKKGFSVSTGRLLKIVILWLRSRVVCMYIF